jgi:hypothetical protein
VFICRLFFHQSTYHPRALLRVYKGGSEDQDLCRSLQRGITERFLRIIIIRTPNDEEKKLATDRPTLSATVVRKANLKIRSPIFVERLHRTNFMACG